MNDERFGGSEYDLPYGPETVTATCDGCGETAHFHEDVCMHHDSQGTDLLCEECKRAERQARLTEALLHGDDEVYSRATAAMHLNIDFPEAFPIADEHRDGITRWIIAAESDSLDGRRFLSKLVEIRDDSEFECPDCGNARVREGHFYNGVVGGDRISCTVCGHVHFEDAG